MRDRDVGVLELLAVDEAHRRNTLGTLLLKHAENAARNAGVASLYVSAAVAPQYFTSEGFRA